MSWAARLHHMESPMRIKRRLCSASRVCKVAHANTTRNRLCGSSYVKYTLVCVLAIFTTVRSPVAHAYSFTPTEYEWGTWPEYCKARYAATMWVHQTQYVGRVNQAIINKWESQLGEAFTPLHHYCAGLVYLQRLRGEDRTHAREVLIRNAENELTYTYDRVPQSSYMYGEVSANLAMLYGYANEPNKAMSILQKAIGIQPEYAGTYSAMSIILGKAGRDVKQLEILLKGNEAVNGESAEIHYFLGLYYMGHDEFEKARNHAIDAYRLGYPLPGLRENLREKGYDF